MLIGRYWGGDMDLSIGQIVVIAAGMGLAAFAVMALISLILNFFVALKSPPTKRASWVVGLSYLGACLAFIFGSGDITGHWGPLIPLLPTPLIFWYWRREYLKAWRDNPEPDETLEDDDWRLGLLKLAIFATVVIGVAAARFFLRNV